MASVDTEHDVAKKVASGELPSPVPFGNMWLVNLRITGTGLAYRAGLEELVWRDPENYLNPQFLARCNGLPVVVNHPETNVLSDSYFQENAVGAVMLPYIRDDEVWAVCRIYNRDVVAEIMRGDVSTSPGVVFNENSGNVELEGMEDNLLIEGKPYLIDHIALVMPERGSLGVWDKNNVPEGIELTSLKENFTMDEENKKLLAQLVAGAVGDALKPVNQQLSTITARMDAAGICDARGDESAETRRRHEREGEERYERRRDTDRRHEREGEERYERRRRDDSRHDESEETRRRHESEGMREYHERQRRNARGDESEETRRRHESEGERAYHERQRRNARGDESEETRRRHEREGEERYERSRHDDSMSEKDIRAEISRLEKKLRREDRDSEHEREGMERYERSRDDFQEKSVHFEKEPKVIEQLRKANANEHGRDEGARRDAYGEDTREDSRRDAADFDGHHIDVRDDEKMADARSRADAAFAAIGKQAPQPFRGESSHSYRRRALAVMQSHSPKHKDVNVRAIADSQALSVIEEAIYNDARQHSENIIRSTPNKMVSMVRTDESGRRIVEYKGDMNAWLQVFKSPPRKVERINTNPMAH